MLRSPFLGLSEVHEDCGEEPLFPRLDLRLKLDVFLGDTVTLRCGETIGLFRMKWMSCCLASSGLVRREFCAKTPLMGAQTCLLDFRGDLNLCSFSMV